MEARRHSEWVWKWRLKLYLILMSKERVGYSLQRRSGMLDQSKTQSWLKDPPRKPSNRGVVGDNPCWSFGDDAWREFDGDGRKCVINSGVSGISAIVSISWKISQFEHCFSFKFIEVEIIMKYEWILWRYKYINMSRVTKTFLKLMWRSFKVRTLHKHFLTWF